MNQRQAFVLNLVNNESFKYREKKCDFLQNKIFARFSDYAGLMTGTGKSKNLPTDVHLHKNKTVVELLRFSKTKLGIWNEELFSSNGFPHNFSSSTNVLVLTAASSAITTPLIWTGTGFGNWYSSTCWGHLALAFFILIIRVINLQKSNLLNCMARIGKSCSWDPQPSRQTSSLSSRFLYLYILYTRWLRTKNHIWYFKVFTWLDACLFLTCALTKAFKRPPECLELVAACRGWAEVFIQSGSGSSPLYMEIFVYICDIYTFIYFEKRKYLHWIAGWLNSSEW